MAVTLWRAWNNYLYREITVAYGLIISLLPRFLYSPKFSKQNIDVTNVLTPLGSSLCFVVMVYSCISIR